MWIFDCTGVGAPNPSIIQVSSVLIFLLGYVFSELCSKRQNKYSKYIKLVTRCKLVDGLNVINGQRGEKTISYRKRAQLYFMGIEYIREHSCWVKFYIDNEWIWLSIKNIQNIILGRYPAYTLYTRNLCLNYSIGISQRGFFRSYFFLWQRVSS